MQGLQVLINVFLFLVLAAVPLALWKVYDIIMMALR